MQRRMLGVLFVALAAGLVAIAVAAIVGAGEAVRGWIVALAALAVAGWLASIGVSALRRR